MCTILTQHTITYTQYKSHRDPTHNHLHKLVCTPLCTTHSYMRIHSLSTQSHAHSPHTYTHTCTHTLSQRAHTQSHAHLTQVYMSTVPVFNAQNSRNSLMHRAYLYCMHTCVYANTYTVSYRSSHSCAHSTHTLCLHNTCTCALKQQPHSCVHIIYTHVNTHTAHGVAVWGSW
jgi:hypothetical protein